MSDLRMTSKREDREFDIHPEGNFMAVCRDIWVEHKPNPNYPGTNQWGNPEPEELVKVKFEFLTDEPIEIGGQMLPRFISAVFNQSWGEKSSLRAFVNMWDPAMGRDEDVDLDTLVGRGCFLTITHNPSKDKTKIWANITTISAPPKGATIPLVPETFVRHKDKAAQ